MTADSPDPQQHSSAWYWPAEWAVDAAFWREVATRTIAGIFTLIFLGSPVVVYAMWNGALTPEQGWPILIGAAFALAVIVLYVVLLAIIRAVTRRKAREALIRDEVRQYLPTLSKEELDTVIRLIGSPEDRDHPDISRRTEERLIELKRSAARASSLAPVAASLFIAAIVAILASWWGNGF